MFNSPHYGKLRMFATIDYRIRPRTVTLKMSLEEFRDTVRWLEELDPQDKATHDWRRELNHVDPPADENAR